MSHSESSAGRHFRASHQPGNRSHDNLSTNPSNDHREQSDARTSHLGPGSPSQRASGLRDCASLSRSESFARTVATALERLKQNRVPTEGSSSAHSGLSGIVGGQGANGVGAERTISPASSAGEEGALD